jgi:hypothetical protein
MALFVYQKLQAYLCCCHVKYFTDYKSSKGLLEQPTEVLEISQPNQTNPLEIEQQFNFKIETTTKIQNIEIKQQLMFTTETTIQTQDKDRQIYEFVLLSDHASVVIKILSLKWKIVSTCLFWRL